MTYKRDLMSRLSSPQYEQDSYYEGEDKQRTAYVQDDVGIGELVHGEAACAGPADVDAVSARLVSGDCEGDGGATAAVDRDALAVFQLAVHVDLDAACPVDRAGAGS